LIILVLGPNGSGKSAYAERLAAQLSAPQSQARVYIATMIPCGEEGLARVEKHRQQRESMGFITIEEPFCVSEAMLGPDAVALLEDVSNLLGNALFGGKSGGSEDGVFADIAAMCGKCASSVLVSISGLSVEREYNDETIEYIKTLDSLNERLFYFADAAVEMRGGEPVVLKGCEPFLRGG